MTVQDVSESSVEEYYVCPEFVDYYGDGGCSEGAIKRIGGGRGLSRFKEGRRRWIGA